MSRALSSGPVRLSCWVARKSDRALPLWRHRHVRRARQETLGWPRPGLLIRKLGWSAARFRCPARPAVKAAAAAAVIGFDPRLIAHDPLFGGFFRGKTGYRCVTGIRNDDLDCIGAVGLGKYAKYRFAITIF